MTDADERRLIGAAQRDPARFAEIYDRYFHLIYGFIVGRTRDRDAAEDLTADTFHRALAALPGYEFRGAPFGAWLLRIAANAVVDRARRDAREVVDSDHLPDTVVSADFDRAGEYAKLFELVDELPMDQQAVITARFIDQRSIRETAEQIGRSEGAVKQLQLRAVEALRRAMQRPRGGVGVEGGHA
jgi:RNA polymerase sigma-70 factor, ECF subfamily